MNRKEVSQGVALLTQKVEEEMEEKDECILKAIRLAHTMM